MNAKGNLQTEDMRTCLTANIDGQVSKSWLVDEEGTIHLFTKVQGFRLIVKPIDNNIRTKLLKEMSNLLLTINTNMLYERKTMTPHDFRRLPAPVCDPGSFSRSAAGNRPTFKGPSQPHLCFCLYGRVWLYLIRSESKMNEITVKLLASPCNINNFDGIENGGG